MMTSAKRLGREDMETLFRALAEHIDRQPPADRERFLAKAFFLLAEGTADLPATLKALDEAAAARDVPGTSRAARHAP